VNLHNPPAPPAWAARRQTPMNAHAGQDGTPTVTLSLLRRHPRAVARNFEPSRDMARPGGRARLLLPPWPPARRRATGVALAAAGWAATWAAVITGGQLSRAAAMQVIFAATMIVCALGQTLLTPASPVTTGDRARPGRVDRRKGPSTYAAVAVCLLGPSAGGAALGAGWATSMLTALAVACAIAGIAAQRPTTGRHPAAPVSR
jgi:hypothetical protein